jgi:hypothetical protein
VVGQSRHGNKRICYYCRYQVYSVWHKKEISKVEVGGRMNDPEVMERIMEALEKIAYYIEVMVGRQ